MYVCVYVWCIYIYIYIYIGVKFFLSFSFIKIKSCIYIIIKSYIIQSILIQKKRVNQSILFLFVYFFFCFLLPIKGLSILFFFFEREKVV